MTESRQPDYAALLKRALIAIDQLEGKLAAAERARNEPIAVIGMGCRFPGGADSPEALWRLLSDGVDTVTEVPAERWDIESVFDPDPDAIGKTYSRWGAFLKDVDQFDAHFFGISPREAVSLDPQQRLLLETTWEALEHAGIAPTTLAGSSTAVYVGITTHDYSLRLATSGHLREVDAYVSSGTAHSMASGRLSYLLGLHGPNVPVDTACSSSLVAMHWAVQSLRSGESKLALAGGVNLTLIPEGSILTSRARMMSFTGRCHAFDAAADGYVRGEGCAMLVLKRLVDARRDGDRVLGVIRGSAVNQDGRSSGLTAPNGIAQAAVIRAALANADLKSADIGYLEAHGTGTSLGDPIEMKALGEVFAERGAAGPLMVGSIKTNIGHTEAAAGVAGVIKALLALQHRTVPPHLHLRNPNPMIAWDRLPITVPSVATLWQSPEGVPRRAGVSSFGFSGTNAHLIIEEAPAQDLPVEADDGTAQLLLLSAEDSRSLTALAGRHAQALARQDGALPSLRAWARSALVSRAAFPERLAVVARTRTDAAKALQAFAVGDSTAPIGQGSASSGVAPELVFMFTGQGAQFVGMGMGLYDTQPAYRTALDECARLVAPHLDRPLISLLRGEYGANALDNTRYTQPALFAHEYALVQLWRAWGAQPTAVLGHSVGEYVAACVAGVFSLEEGLRLIAHRARLMSELPHEGGMAAVFADEASVSAGIADEPRLAVAAVNGSANTVVSGASDALDRVLAKFTATGIEWQRLKVSHAFHSPLMDPMLDAFEAVASSVSFAPPRIGLVSNLNGRFAGEDVCTPSYWRRHLREAVRFGDSLATLANDGYRVFLEVGPQPVLSGMAQRAEQVPGGLWISSLRKGRDDQSCALEALGQLWVRGVPALAQGLWGESATQYRVELPRYPFQRQRYWLDLHESGAQTALVPTKTGHPLLGGVVASPLHLYQTELGPVRQAWLADHRIFDFMPLPATAWLELALAAGYEALGTASELCLRDVIIREALMLPTDGTATLQAVVTPVGGATATVALHSRDVDVAGSGEWRSHVSATVEPFSGNVTPRNREAFLPADADVLSAADYYANMAAAGQNYGQTFRGITEIRHAGRKVLGHVELPAAMTSEAARMQVHPALLDACLQLMGVVLLGGDNPTYVPVGVDRLRVHRPGAREAWCQVSIDDDDGDAAVLRADIVLFDAFGTVIAELDGVEMRRITRETLSRASLSPANWCFEIQWQPSPLAATPRVTPAGHWLLLSDSGGVGDLLAARLREAGARVSCVHPEAGSPFAQAGDTIVLDPADRVNWQRLFAEMGALQGIVSLWALDAKVPFDSPEAINRALSASLAQMLQEAQALAEVTARLWITTRGAQEVAGSMVDAAQSSLWGLAGVIASEYPALKCVRLDLDSSVSRDDADRVYESLCHLDDEGRVAWRGAARWVARLRPHALAAAQPSQAYSLEISERGSLSNLMRRVASRAKPGPGEVEIRIHATGLNFRDVLSALGMYPGDPGPLGNECTGVVTALGTGVNDLAVGDEVVSMTDRSFATWVTAPANLTVRKPFALSFSGAATIPVAFLTADHALNTLGNMGPGTRVLIHAITGGVGMAAAQLARLAGARIFGTAGTPAKRALARQLGAEVVGDSRSLSFVEDVRAATRGEGVDIVLNSLAGDFIPASLGLVRAGGRFVEIGKSDDWDAARVAERFPAVQYTRLYLGEVTAADPGRMRERLRRMLEDFAAGRLTPLPQRVYPIERAEEAFRYMAQGQHVGKIVITQPVAPAIRADASYLVTGGLGGLGLACADWLAAEGARHLLLLGRRAPTDAALAAIARLREQGVAVRVAQTDVADPAQLEFALRDVPATWPRLRGVLHAAGSVDDGMLAELNMARFAPVMAPKVQGSWNLHQFTMALPLDFFVMFSSGAGLLGAPGQGNYAAANSFMDGLAHWRRAQGLPALSVNWGSWSGVGMASEVGEQHQRRWAAMGLSMIHPADGVHMLRDMLSGSQAPQLAALPLVRTRLPAQLGPFFAELRVASTEALASHSPGTAVDVRHEIERAPASERPSLLQFFLADQLVKVLALGAGTQVDQQRSVMEMGLDSLMAMELRNRIQAGIGVRVSVADLLRGPSIKDLSARFLEELDLPDGAAEPTALSGAAAKPRPAWEEGSL